VQFNLIRDELEKYLCDIPLSCPYSLPHQAIYRQALTGRLPDPIMARFLDGGFRRSGNCIYIMGCRTCNSCVPIRIDPQTFRPNRCQRRALRHNRDLAVETGPIEATDEALRLCSAFLRNRYPGHGNNAEEYYHGFFANRITDTFEIRYRLNGRLIGVAVVDVGGSWLNAVYFFFDPQESRRGMGTFNILNLIDHCRQWHIDHLYLGYWIREVSAMAYKANFNPHELLIDGVWQTVAGKRSSAPQPETISTTA